MRKHIRRYCLSLFLACSIMFLAFTIWGADTGNIDDGKRFEPLDAYNSRACGPICLRIAAARLGTALDITQLIKDCELTDKGTSLLRLKQVAEKYGLQAEGVRLTWQELVKTNAPVIVYLNKSHFCCIDPRERNPENGRQARMYCPGKTAQWIGQNDITKSWHGESLVIRNQKKQVTASIPRLQFDSLLVDFGSVEPCELLETRFPFQNTGRAPLRIARIKKSCGCTTATVSKSILNPGEKGEIKLHLSATGRAGYQNLSMYVETNDPATSITELQYTGVINQKVHISKSVLDFGDVYPGQTISQDIEVTERDGKHDLIIEGADVQYEQITKNEHIPVTEIRYVPESKIRESIIFSYPAKRSIQSVDNSPIKYRVMVKVSIPSNEPYGPLKGQLEIATKERGKPDIHVPVTMNVVSDVYVVPSNINIGVLKPKAESVKTFTVKRRSGKPVRIVKSFNEMTSQTSGVSVKVETKKEEADHATMELTVHRSENQKSNVILKGNVKFIFDSGEELQCEWKGFCM